MGWLETLAGGNKKPTKQEQEEAKKRMEARAKGDSTKGLRNSEERRQIKELLKK